MGLLDFLRHGQGSEVSTPPPSLDQSQDARAPLAALIFTYSQRREPHAGPSLLGPQPDDSFNAMLPLHIAPQEAPDPVRQSQFYADGNKVHPWAQQRITSNLNIGPIEAVMQDQFEIGKLLGYWRINTFAGEQLPSVLRANIREAVPTTYGSQYQVDGLIPSGTMVLATGMEIYGTDGDPYS